MIPAGRHYAPAVTDRQVLIVSNRGPLSFRRGDDGALVARRGGGGLVSGLGPVVERTGAIWIAAALSDDDREAVRTGLVEEQEGPPVRLVDLDPADHTMAYNVVSNAVLWYLHHHLWDLARLPRFDHHFAEAWDAYRRVNDAFAAVVADLAEPNAIVLVQDLHLTMVGRALADQRPDLSTLHFSHTPFGAPEMVDVLPDAVSGELVGAMAAHTAVGFHSPRWEQAFRHAAEARSIDPGLTFVSPLPTDADDIRGVAAGDACNESVRALDALVGDRQVIARVDRIELSKNLLRGFHAYDALLQRHPSLRERVVFVASVYPSREGLADYLAYRREVEGLVERINRTWGTEGWTPIELDTSDDFARSVAVLRRYDALLVNPIRDGLNLVAKEGPIVNERDGVVLLSRQAGVWDELADHVTEVHPFDIDGTADALAAALATSADERQRTAAALREAAVARRPMDWLEDQLALVS
jgi:trehalose 6-phosphate synthase